MTPPSPFRTPSQADRQEAPNLSARVLFLFLDGIGLGAKNPATNPLARATMPNLQTLLDGCALTQELFERGQHVFTTSHATVLELDARMGVAGTPQSATGQATLLTGVNVPGKLGLHFGPKPNREIKELLSQGTVFSALQRRGYQPALLNAYPQKYFDGLQSGRRLPGVIAMAARLAGLPLKTRGDLMAGDALSADFTGKGWHTRLNMPEIQVLSLPEAANRMAALGQRYDFSLFEYWISDYAGHSQDMDTACDILKTLDTLLGALFSSWAADNGLIVITSDHGNLENLGTRRHTTNPVPLIAIGPEALRRSFCAGMHNLADITPALLKLYSPRRTDIRQATRH